MVTSRITEGENRNLQVTIMEISMCFVGLLTLNSLTLDFIWLLYMSYIS